MTIYIPVWLYWYCAAPTLFVLGYLLGRLHKPGVLARDPYCEVREEMRARLHEAHAEHETNRALAEAPTTKRERPTDGGTWDEDKS